MYRGGGGTGESVTDEIQNTMLADLHIRPCKMAPYIHQARKSHDTFPLEHYYETKLLSFAMPSFCIPLMHVHVQFLHQTSRSMVHGTYPNVQSKFCGSVYPTILSPWHQDDAGDSRDLTSGWVNFLSQEPTSRKPCRES